MEKQATSYIWLLAFELPSNELVADDECCNGSTDRV
jgi:hypothetical protein